MIVLFDCSSNGCDGMLRVDNVKEFDFEFRRLGGDRS